MCGEYIIKLYVVIAAVFQLQVAHVSAECSIDPDEKGHVDIPGNWESISYRAFFECTSIQSVSIPGSITAIGQDAFKYCKHLKSVTMDSGVKSIGVFAFSDTSLLRSISIPNTVTSIGTGAFAWSGLVSMSLGTGISTISNSVFRGTNLESFTVPNGVISIEAKAFSWCKSLQSISLPASLTSIGDQAFANCSKLESVMIPHSVSSLGDEVFSTCSSLTELLLPNSTTSIGKKTCYRCSSLKNVVIPDKVVSIGAQAFQYCVGMQSLTLGSGVTSIAAYAFHVNSLQSAMIPSGVEEIGNYAFRYSGIESLTFEEGNQMTEIDDYVFSMCKKLSSVILPLTLQEIGKYAFFGSESLVNISLPASLISIGQNAFQKSGLRAIELLSVTTVGMGGFAYSPWLTNVTLGKSVTTLGNSSFAGCKALTRLDIDSGVVGSYYFAKVYLPGSSNIKEVRIGESVTRVGPWAFFRMTSLTTVIMGDSVSSVGNKAFEGCTALSTLKLSSSLEKIGDHGFQGNSLTFVDLPPGLTSLGGYAFAYCKNLQNVTFPSGLKTIGKIAFQNSRLRSVLLPKSVISIGESAFSNILSLRSVVIETEGTLTIGDKAFSGDTVLSQVVINAMTSLSFGGPAPFSFCPQLDSIYLRRGLLSITGALSARGYSCPTKGEACKCKPGFENMEGEDSSYFLCSPCARGSYSAGFSLESGACKLCEAGTYVSISEASSCEPCDVGKHLETEGATTVSACQNCEVGRYGDIKGLPTCTSCPAGKFSSSLKATSISTCQACSMGTFSETPGASVCRVCPLGTFGSTTGVSSCSPCALGRYAETTSITACSPCPRNSYTVSMSSTSISDCLPCPKGRTAEMGAKVCEDCSAGKYASTDGLDCERCPVGKSTNSLTGQSECLECQAGSFQAGMGAASCEECPVNFYSTVGSTECAACPSGKTTNDLKGSASCFDPKEEGGSSASDLDLRSRAGVLNVFRSGMAYMITVLLMVAFAIFGLLFINNRKQNARLVPLSPPLVFGRLAIAALSMSSEAFMLAIMFVEGTTTTSFFYTLGLVVVGFRALNVVPTALILIAIFGSAGKEGEGEADGLSARYKKCFDREHFLASIYPYAALCSVALLECQLCFLLPWKYSEFAYLAKGFPDMLTLRATSYYKIIQDSARFICNILYLRYATDEASEASVETMTYFNLLASVASIVIAGMVAIAKNSILQEVEATKGTAADNEVTPDALFSSSAKNNKGDDGDIELSDVYGNIEYTDNPLHGDEEGGARNLTRLKSMTIRNYLIELLPDGEIDASSLHAVHSAFKNDGVESVDDMLKYLDGGVLTLSDLKGYTKHGKLSMGSTLRVTKAVEGLLFAYRRALPGKPDYITSQYHHQSPLSPSPSLSLSPVAGASSQYTPSLLDPERTMPMTPDAGASPSVNVAATLEMVLQAVRAQEGLKAQAQGSPYGNQGQGTPQPQTPRGSIVIPASVTAKRASSKMMVSITENVELTHAVTIPGQADASRTPDKEKEEEE